MGAGAQKRAPLLGGKILSVVTATVGWSLFPGTGHTRTAPTPELSRKPQFLKACGGRRVPDLGTAVPRTGWVRGISQLDFVIGLRPQLNSKFTLSFPPPTRGARHASGPLPSAQGCPSWKLAALEGTVVWEPNASLQPSVRKY